MIYITTEAHFDSAHFLPGYDGKCQNMHGHRWTIQATMGPWSSQELDEVGIAYDFGDLKHHLKVFADLHDHKVLNDFPGLESPTAEKLALALWTYLAGWTDHTKVYEVKVFESPDSFVAVRR